MISGENKVSNQGPFTIVEYPALVINKDKALKNLTFGEEQVSLLLDSQRTISKGDYCPANSLVLKVTRDNAGIIVGTEILGKVDKFVRFRSRNFVESYCAGLLDFQMDQPEQSDLDLKTMDVAASLDLDQIRQLAETLGDESWRTEEILRRGLPSFPPPRFTPSDFPFQLSSSSFSGLAVEVFLGLCL
jgi:hypothetical protein